MGRQEKKKVWRQGFENAVLLRGVEIPCGKCDGLGVRSYPQTNTWRGGIGGNLVTKDVCDVCWGSGDARPWPSWRRIEPLLAAVREHLQADAAWDAAETQAEATAALDQQAAALERIRAAGNALALAAP